MQSVRRIAASFLLLSLIASCLGAQSARPEELVLHALALKHRPAGEGLLRVSPPPPPGSAPRRTARPPRPGELVLHAFALKHRPAGEALALVSPLLSDRGTAALQPRSHTLVIRDTPASPRTLAQTP